VPAPIAARLRILSRLPFPARAVHATAAAVLLASALLATTVSTSIAASVAPPCAPAKLNISAALAGGAINVSPAPDTLDASFLTQLSFLGVPAACIAKVAVVG
jgi:hypothetical protein